MAETTPQSQSLSERALQTYGDLVFDLCESMLWNSSNAQIALRKVLSRIDKDTKEIEGSRFERARILRIVCEVLRTLAADHTRRLTKKEQLKLTSTHSINGRLREFDRFFHRLSDDERLVLLLKDKYGLPFGEISIAMNFPEGTLKILRAQALRALESWIWESPL